MSDHRPFALPGATAHYGPDHRVQVVHYDLHLRPDIAARTLEGRCTVTLRAIAPDVTELVLDAVDLQIRAVHDADGADLPFRSAARTLTLVFGAPLPQGSDVRVSIDYRAVDPVRGLYFPAGVRQVWTQSQDEDARSWFPCLDHPSYKQTTSHTIVVPRGDFALGNGALVERVDDGEQTIWRYEQRAPHPTYLTTLVAGAFATVDQPHARVPVAYHVAPGREADGERAFGNTPRMIDVFESVLGVPYPWDRYGQVAVADFIFGGMENTAATTQTDRTLHDERAHLDFRSDPLVSHELAHQWFGDLVTCRDWSQAWLNESFATYMETVWREADLGWDEYLYAVLELTRRYLDEDADRYRRPIVCNVYRDPIELFDRHLYEKGGAVLHALRGELGWESLRRSLRRYLEDNRFRNVETLDLIRAIEAETGRNLRWFFDQWVERGGHPSLEIGYRWDAAQRVAIVTVEQKQPVDETHPPYRFALDVGFVAELPQTLERDAGEAPLRGEIRRRLTVTSARESFAVPLEEPPSLVRVDPAAWILGTVKLTWETEPLVATLTRDPSPLARIRAVQALARDGSRAAREALAQALDADPFWGVGVEIAAELGRASAPSSRARLLAAVAHPHPKVRRAVAEALGAYRDGEVATALLALRDDPSYFVVAAALASLGKTRDPRGFDVLVAALNEPSWNETIAAGAARGLGESADPRALEPLVAAMSPRSGEGLRRAAVGAIARLGNLEERVRTRAFEALDAALRDPSYLVRVAAFAAAETLEDPRLLAALDRLAVTETDGRLRRDAAEAAIRVREAQKVPAEVTRIRDEIDRLREESRALRERLDALRP